MPRITLIDEVGQAYTIDTRNPDILRAWFDDILPHINPRPDPGFCSALIEVRPLCYSHEPHTMPPDWLADTRVLGSREAFWSRTGAEAMTELAALRARLERKLAELGQRT